MVGAAHFTIEKHIAGMVSQIMKDNFLRELAVPGYRWNKGKTKAQFYALSDIKGIIALQSNTRLKTQPAADFICQRLKAITGAHGYEWFVLKIPGS